MFGFICKLDFVYKFINSSYRPYSWVQVFMFIETSLELLPQTSLLYQDAWERTYSDKGLDHSTATVLTTYLPGQY